MSRDLMDASKQWAVRPADERYDNLPDMYLDTMAFSEQAQTFDLNPSSVKVQAIDDGLVLHSAKRNIGFSHWSFSQFANKFGGAAEYLRQLPAELAAKNLNHFIDLGDATPMKVYLDGPSNIARAITSKGYARIFNHEVVQKVMLAAKEGGWRTPPARPAKANQPGTRKATKADVMPGSLIKVGDTIAPAGLYASDRDIFLFLINPEIRIEDGTDGGLSRGFFARNSEVGDGSFEITDFWFRYVCGNHIVWGAEMTSTFKVKHIGMARKRAFENLEKLLNEFKQESYKEDELAIKAAKAKVLGANEEEIIDLVYKATDKGISQKDLGAAWDIAEENRDVDGDPTTAWGFAQGITRLSQQKPYANERTQLDRMAGKVLELAAV